MVVVMKKILVIVLAAYVFSPLVYIGTIEPAYATPKTKPGKKNQKCNYHKTEFL